MKNFEKGAFDEGFEMNTNCFCENKKVGKDRFVITVDDSQNCEVMLTGIPFQKVFIDLSECKANIKKLEEDMDSMDAKKQKTLSKRGSIK